MAARACRPEPGPGLHAEFAAHGCFLGYDGMAPHRLRPDSDIVHPVDDRLDADCADRVVLGGDVARRTRDLAYGGMPGLVGRLLVNIPAAVVVWRREGNDDEAHSDD